MDAARWAFSSRAGAVKPRSVSGCAAVLYSSRWAASKLIPALSSAERRNSCSTVMPVSPRLPDGCR